MSDRQQAGKPSRFVTSQSGQLSLLASAGRKMSTIQSAVTSKGTLGRQVWFIPLVDKRVDGRPSLTCVIPKRFRDELVRMKRYTKSTLV